MKKLLSFLAIVLISVSSFGAQTATDRRSMAVQWGSAPRTTTVSKNQIRATTTTDATTTTAVATAIEQQKQACINNNIGAGNTFVWASKYSNTSNYSSMVEDTEVPENNVCFVRVDLKSSDSKVDISDIAPVYYPMGQSIVCGNWADSGKIKDRILDAKKSARTWGTVAGAVGGAGVGVGAMELFGNKLIGGKVEGQKDKKLTQDEVLRSQLLVFKQDDKNGYDKLKMDLEELQEECESVWSNISTDEKPEGCKSVDYINMLAIMSTIK
ncbi:MAG TPA: hypothetical protein PLZ05_01275 [Alphaproteobacteria bacterium]|nr:hypothetical protein [Alphaproteobacteria bacterium]